MHPQHFIGNKAVNHINNQKERLEGKKYDQQENNSLQLSFLRHMIAMRTKYIYKTVYREYSSTTRLGQSGEVL